MQFGYSYIPANFLGGFLTTKEINEINVELAAFSCKIFQSTTSYLGYFHIPADLNQVLGSTEIEKNELLIYLCF